METKNEEKIERVLTQMQRDEVKMAELRETVRLIGRDWVAKAAGYHNQTITDFVQSKRGVKKLQNAILSNLGVALRMKQEYQRREDEIIQKKVNETLILLRQENPSQN